MSTSVCQISGQARELVRVTDWPYPHAPSLAPPFPSDILESVVILDLKHIEVGLSLYEYHADGSGVHYSSYLRPVLNLKPRGTMWSFNADTNMTAWLEHLDIGFDVITDEDLHREGATLLSHYDPPRVPSASELPVYSKIPNLPPWLSE